MMQDFSDISTERLLGMQKGAKDVLECQRVLSKTGMNVISETLRGVTDQIEMQHYPKGDVYDHETHGQYYYHSHRAQEHGHFHLFLRQPGMPRAILCRVGEPQDCFSHLVALSMDPFGMLRGLFTTNRWVSGENWYGCEDVILMLDHFCIDHAYPSWPTNRWLSGIVKMFYPQICDLLRSRDRVVGDWQEQHPDRDVLEDRELEIPSEIACSVAQQVRAIDEELVKRQNKDAAL